MMIEEARRFLQDIDKPCISISMPFRKLKHLVVQLIGRNAANRISGPYHDWIAARRTRHVLTKLPTSNLCVHLGCGPRSLAKWINVDWARNSGVDVVWDLRAGLPFPSSSCGAVFGEHVIEHFSKIDGQSLVKECHRVLQPGGILRLSTPDAGLYLKSYAGDGEFLSHPSFGKPAETRMDRINHVMREEGQHLWLYDAESLMFDLSRAGFSYVIKQAFGQSRHSSMNGIDLASRAFESLYVEGVK